MRGAFCTLRQAVLLMPLPARRSGEDTVVGAKASGEAIIANDGNVVPYSPYNTMRHGSHINCEVCSSETSPQYLCKVGYAMPARGNAFIACSPHPPLTGPRRCSILSKAAPLIRAWSANKQSSSQPLAAARTLTR